MNEKKCAACGVVKSSDDFHRNRNKPDGLQTACKVCRKTQNANWYKSNKEPHNTKRKAWTENRRLENTEKLVEHLQNHPCVDCGETDPLVLELDHVTGTKVAAVTRLTSGASSWEKVANEIDKCVVRCANCHRRKTAKERNHLRYQILMRP